MFVWSQKKEWEDLVMTSYSTNILDDLLYKGASHSFDGTILLDSDQSRAMSIRCNLLPRRHTNILDLRSLVQELVAFALLTRSPITRQTIKIQRLQVQNQSKSVLDLLEKIWWQYHFLG
jgi:hypothetical protein